MKRYDHKKIEQKWQIEWEKNRLYQVDLDDDKKPKFYALDMFPYPSGEGLHVGHPKGYIATDIFSRYKKMNGHNILHPMGWDAFGLPAENYALKNKIHPKKAVEKNIANFKNQIDKLGFNYDWSKEINTTDPEYYRWTQWAFIQMFKKGLAYQSNEPIIWCPSCQTGLAQEDLEEGKCERCGSEIEMKPIRQWVLKITDYAERLLKDLDDKDLDWEEQIIDQQKNWIGKSIGTEVIFEANTKEKEKVQINVFTTRADTLFGATFLVLAPEHPLVGKLTGKEKKKEVEAYQKAAAKKTDLAREGAREKSGVFIGSYAINPVNQQKIPIWIADYVLIGYGTGAVMAVPAHDERDYEFARKFNIEIITSIEPVTGEPRKDEEKRSSIVAMVRNPKDNKLLSINWGEKLGGNLFVGGGKEEGEDPVKCAVREIEEETGYKNVKLIATSETVHHHYFAHSKNVAREIEAEGLYFELSSQDNGGQKLHENERDKFKVEWITIDQADKNVKDPLHHYLFEKFIKGVVYISDGILVDSGQFSGLTSAEARKKMTEWLEKKNLGGKKINYKMHDWVFSRQRYWGEPIPIVHCHKCGTVPVPESDLPVLLPEVENYKPTGTGESPLANIADWVVTSCPKCHGEARRETNTMPQWAGSSWYYLRYIDPKNDKKLVSKDKENYWMPVDLYVGGAEHATRHLLYARFWHKVLYDLKIVSTKEPFKRLIHVGLISGTDGRKMSKRWGNVINPDVIVNKYGADALRVYEMFMGPFNQEIAWSEQGIKGARKFLDRLYSLLLEKKRQEIRNQEEWQALNTALAKVSHDIEEFKFNTAIATLMSLVNFLEKKTGLSIESSSLLVKMIAPFAPFFAEELWSNLGNQDSVHLTSWPSIDKKACRQDQVAIAVQINGKIRDQVTIVPKSSQETVLQLAQERSKVQKYLTGQKIEKVFYIPDRILSIVTEE